MRQALGCLAIVAVVLIASVGGCAVMLDGSASIDYFKVSDPRTIVVGIGSCPSLWTRVSSVDETDTQVLITARSLDTPFVASTCMNLTELTVLLKSDLGDREVIDATSGREAFDCSKPFAPQFCLPAA